MIDDEYPYRAPSSLWEPQEMDPEAMLKAYYDCFTTEPGMTVLRHLYEGICSTDLTNVRDLGAIRVYQTIIQNIRLYRTLREQQRE